MYVATVALLVVLFFPPYVFPWLARRFSRTLVEGKRILACVGWALLVVVATLIFVGGAVVVVIELAKCGPILTPFP